MVTPSNIKFVTGDMFDTDFDVRINTVNCVGVMGKGIALEFKKRYPDMFSDYRYNCLASLLHPGKLSMWSSFPDEIIVNFPTKGHWREKSKYEYIEAGLKELRAYLERLGAVTVAVPALGCNNGGLEWKRVRAMIKKELSGLQAKISVFKPMEKRSEHT